MRVRRISLPLSNAFLVSDRSDILVDAGCQGDHTSLIQQIKLSGVSAERLAAVVLTHVHFDHCGCAAAFQSLGVPIVAAQASVRNLASGTAEGGPWTKYAPRRLMSSSLGRKLQMGFPPVQVDCPVNDECSLEEFGVDGRIVLTPGHTEASLSVVLADGSACVGDLLMGGFFGLPPAWKPAQHPWSAEPSLCLAQARTLRAMGCVRFYVGHGDTLEGHFIDDFLNQKI
jgi:glyoxylase-like metal-dependent hydrolase (beta-lactamase superfamily II)